MVLTKLFNILTITASIGSSILTTPEKPEINRVVNNEEYNINIETIDDVEETELNVENTQYENIYTYGKQVSIDTTHITGTIIKFTNKGIYTDSVNDIEYGQMIGSGKSNTNHVKDEENGMIGTQQLYLIKLNTIGTNVNMKLKLSMQTTSLYKLSNMITQTNNTNYTQKFIYRMLTSQNAQALDKYFTYGSLQSLFDNQIYINDQFTTYELYDRFTKILTTNAGYTNTYTEGLQNITTNNNQNYFELERNIQLYPNKSTYYVIHIEPKQTKDNVEDMILMENKLAPSGAVPYPQIFIDNETSYRIYGMIAVNPNTQEVIDVPGVMFDVLGMPFTFISTAFNLTLFPNTPYELNISLLFLSIVAVIIFVFLIKFIIGRFN